MSRQEIERRAEEIRRREHDVRINEDQLLAEKAQLRADCPHPPEYSDPDGLGNWCGLCGGFSYDT